MLGYIAGVVFRDVLGGDSDYCRYDPPGFAPSQSVLLSVQCVSPKYSLSRIYIGVLLIHGCSLEPQLAANDSFTSQ